MVPKNGERKRNQRDNKNTTKTQKKKCPGVSEHARGVKLACFPFKVLNLAWLTSEAQTGTKETKITLKSQKKSKET